MQLASVLVVAREGGVDVCMPIVPILKSYQENKLLLTSLDGEEGGVIRGSGGGAAVCAGDRQGGGGCVYANN